MIELTDLTHWTDRLKSQCVVFGDRVFKTIPDDELTIDLHESPVAFVYLAEDSSDENRTKNSTQVIQAMTADIAVEIIIRRSTAHADLLNAAAVDSIRAYRTEVFNALLGWRSPGSSKPVQHRSGKLLKKDPKQLRWVDTFSAENIISN